MACLEKRLTRNSLLMYLNIHRKLSVLRKGISGTDSVLLAITGDPGDGIPGCKGVSSAAAPLVAEYKTLDAIYEAIEDCEDVAKKEKELNTFWKENLGIGRSL